MGLVWGSFLNVVIYRLTHKQSPLSGRSVCPSCKKVISWKYNIPLLSYFWLGGRCHNCHKKISWQYPVIELVTGALFVWWFMVGRGFFLLAGTPWGVVQPIFWLVVGMLLLVVFMADFRFGIIPDSVNLALVSLSLFYRLGLVLTGQMDVRDFLLAGISAAVITMFFLSLWLMTKKKGFGMGDIKLAPALGLLLGWQRSIVAIFISFIVGGIFSAVLLIMRKKKMGQTVPFGPFLVFGAAVGLLWGARIWQWYFSLM